MATAKKKNSKNTGRKPAQKKTANKAPQRQTARESAPDSTQIREIVGVVFLLLGALFGYFLLTSPAAGFGSVMAETAKGLSGAMSFAVPILFWWLGAVIAFSGRARKITPLNALLITLLALFVLSFIHVFRADEIRSVMRVYDWKSFIIASFNRKIGAGALGALFSWPLYKNFGIAGAVMIILAMVIIDLILLHKVSLTKLGSSAHETAAQMKDGYREWQEKRRSRLEEERAIREEANVLREESYAESDYF